MATTDPQYTVTRLRYHLAANRRLSTPMFFTDDMGNAVSELAQTNNWPYVQWLLETRSQLIETNMWSSK